ncbi:hypothetical protein BH09BAC2_BH09BAC2_11060 [soil metagenome]
MKNLFFICLSIVVFSGCIKSDVTCKYGDSTATVPVAEIQQVQTYLNNNSITDAVQSPAGFFYKITATGSGASVVNLCSQVTVKYVGKLTNGTVFDQTPAGQTATFELGRVIIGWQKGIPLVNAGGKITLYIPPSLGYGSQTVGTPPNQIPANSILIFEVEVVSIS